MVTIATIATCFMFKVMIMIVKTVVIVEIGLKVMMVMTVILNNAEMIDLFQQRGGV